MMIFFFGERHPPKSRPGGSFSEFFASINTFSKTFPLTKHKMNYNEEPVTISLYPALAFEEDLTPDATGSEIEEKCNAIQEACKGMCEFLNLLPRFIPTYTYRNLT